MRSLGLVEHVWSKFVFGHVPGRGRIEAFGELRPSVTMPTGNLVQVRDRCFGALRNFFPLLGGKGFEIFGKFHEETLACC